MYAQWFTGFATLFLAFVALFKDTVLMWIQKPKIDIEFELRPPDCFKSQVVILQQKLILQQREIERIEFYLFYYRLRIINKGKSPAKYVEVAIRDIKKKKGNSFERMDFVLDDNLDLASSKLIAGRKSVMYYKFISPGTFKHCELGHILDPSKRNLDSSENNKLFRQDKTIFAFNVMTRYHSLYHIIEPGTYRFKILVAGENFDALEKIYELKITGKWSEKEDIMLDEGLKLKEVKLSNKQKG